MDNKLQAMVDRAAASGCRAKTAAGALRYLRRQIADTPPSALAMCHSRLMYTDISRGDPSVPDQSRRAWLAARHSARLDARYSPRAQEWMAATGLPLLDPARERARVRAIERRAEVAAALVSNEERALLAAGYALARDGAHRQLTGMDDGHPFAVRVPLRCRTISEALAWLRPDGVPDEGPRRGEWFFVPSAPEPEGETWTEAGSRRTVRHHRLDAGFDTRRRHTVAGDCLAVVAAGETVFVGRRQMQSHRWRGRTRIYIRGSVEHPEHGRLDLPEGWHEVIPNRAHGPFAVGRFDGGID